MPQPFLCALILKCRSPLKVAKWYKDVLGLTLEKRGREYSGMLGPTHFAIHGLGKGQLPTSHVELGFHVADVDDFVKGLEMKGVELADPIRDYPWARAAQVKDPMGNVIYLMQLPKAALKAIGKNLAKEFLL